jgi:hypothetical protein
MSRKGAGREEWEGRGGMGRERSAGHGKGGKREKGKGRGGRRVSPQTQKPPMFEIDDKHLGY